MEKLNLKKKKNKGMKKMKKPKLILGAVVVILIFSLLPGAQAAKSTKLALEVIEWEDPGAPPVPPPTIPFVEDGVLHIKEFWSANLIEGKIGNDIITGYSILLFHLKQDLATGNSVFNGQNWVYFTWGDLEGYFAGTVNGKVVNGVLYAKFTMQGFEDFEGMKSFGIVRNIMGSDPPTNSIYGTILVPN